MKRSRYALPYQVWMALFIIVPIFIVLYYACTTSNGASVSFSLENLAQVFSPTYLTVLVRSLWIALVATLICLLIGYPVASILASRHFKRSSLILMLIIIPMWMNFLLRTYAWMTLLENNGLVNKFFGLFGLGPFEMINTQGAVVLGMVYNYLPFMILPLYSVMVKIENSLIEAAADLGCSAVDTMRRVILPLSMPGISTGIIMVFVPSVSTFVISRMLGGGSFMLIGDLIEMEFLGNAYNPNLGAAISTVLMLIILVSMALTDLFRNSEEKEGLLL